MRARREVYRSGFSTRALDGATCGQVNLTMNTFVDGRDAFRINTS